METLNKRGFEKSDFPITVNFKDKDGVDMIPESVVWNLSTMAGDIINGREHVSITPAATIYIPVSGEDVTVLEDEAGDRIIQRLLTIMATYTSNLGSGKPLNKSVILEFEASVGIKDNLYISISDNVSLIESVTKT